MLFFGDSGGYQVLQNKLGNLKDPKISKKLTWEKVIKWQMKVCDIGMTLDIPTPRSGIRLRIGKSLKIDLKNLRKMLLQCLSTKINI